jgi:hypothetical protein
MHQDRLDVLNDHAVDYQHDVTHALLYLSHTDHQLHVLLQLHPIVYASSCSSNRISGSISENVNGVD